MSGKLFMQIIALIVIAIVLMNAAKCLKRNYCPIGKKAGLCASGVAKGSK